MKTHHWPADATPAALHAIAREDATLDDLRAAIPDCETWSRRARTAPLASTAAARSFRRMVDAIDAENLPEAIQAARILWLIRAD